MPIYESTRSDRSVQMSSTAIPTSSLSRNELLAASLSGALAFPAVLGLGQVGLFKPLRLTCSSSLASVFGGASVLVAGCIASATAVYALSLTHHWEVSSQPDSPSVSNRKTVEFGARELLVSTTTSAIMFRALGGRFSSVLPSHLLKPGAFAQEWIPVRSTQATERQRHIVKQLGKSHGCHSCGTRSVKQFHADHQPPNKIQNGLNSLSNSANGILQRLYPQCKKCSSLQGALLAHGNNGSRHSWNAIRTHPLSLRAYHLFLPIPFAVAYLKSTNSSSQFSTEHSQQKLSSAAVEAKERDVQTAQVVASTPDVEQASTVRSFQTLFGESSLPSLIRDFPLLIIWNRIVYFLDSFHNAGDAFHITLWAFAIVAALGTT